MKKLPFALLSSAVHVLLRSSGRIPPCTPREGTPCTPLFSSLHALLRSSGRNSSLHSSLQQFTCCCIIAPSFVLLNMNSSRGNFYLSFGSAVRVCMVLHSSGRDSHLSGFFLSVSSLPALLRKERNSHLSGFFVSSSSLPTHPSLAFCNLSSGRNAHLSGFFVSSSSLSTRQSLAFYNLSSGRNAYLSGHTLLVLTFPRPT